MKIGMCMFLWTTKLTSEHQDLLRDIKATGFDGIEVPVFDGTADDFARTGDMLDQIGLQRTAVAAMGDPSMNLISSSRKERQAGIAHMRWALDCSQALGATSLCGPLHSTLGHFSGTGPTLQERQFSVESQREIGDHAARTGVVVALEALNRFECYLFNTMKDLSEHIDEIGHPNIRAMYDTFHANIEETDPIAAFSDNMRSIAHIHISENDRGVPGRGNIDWDGIYSAIRDSGYDGWLTIEAFGRSLPDLAAATKVWRDFAESPEAVYREGYRHIHNGLMQVGNV